METKNKTTLIIAVAGILLLAAAFYCGWVTHKPTTIIERVSNDSINLVIRDLLAKNQNDSIREAQHYQNIQSILQQKDERIKTIEHFNYPDIDNWVQGYCARKNISCDTAAHD